MTITKRINSWFNLVKQSFFTYKDGFFQISYLSNSPQIIIESCSKMPFVTHNTNTQTFHSSTPFFETTIRYAELEDGLWIMYNNFYYKNNIVYKPFYDKHSPATFYYLTFNKIENEYQTNFYEFQEYKIQNYSITLVKPQKKFLFSHFKGSKENIVLFLVEEAWVKKNIINSGLVNEEVKQLFLNDDIEYLNYHFKQEEFVNNLNEFIAVFESIEVLDLFELKRLSYQFFKLFFNLVSDKDKEKDSTEFYKLNKEDILKVEKVEQFLLSNLYLKFCGIDYLSKKFNISPTKLKHDFKLVFNSSIFKYYQQKQMKLAFKLLQENNLTIKELSQRFDYENVSKFSSAFKKYNNQLPSKIKKKE